MTLVSKPVRHADAVFVVEVNIIHFIPHPITDDFGIRHLPTPCELEKLIRDRPRSGVAFLHHSLDPFRVVVARTHFPGQKMLQCFDLRLFGVRIKENVIFRWLAIEALDRQRKATEVVKVVVVVDDAIEIGCTAMKAFLNSGQRVAVLVRIDRSPGLHGIRVRHLSQIGISHLIARFPGPGLLDDTIDACSVRSFGGSKDSQQSPRARALGRFAATQSSSGGHPVPSYGVHLELLVAPFSRGDIFQHRFQRRTERGILRQDRFI